MEEEEGRIVDEPLEPLIFSARGQRVILDADLARLYGVTTKALNQAVDRNVDRFPSDFAFRLTADEAANLKSQFVTSSLNSIGDQSFTRNRSQIVTGSHGGARKPKRVFTEHGALMAANVLRSEAAVQMSVFVVRAFVRLREQAIANAAILKRLAEIDQSLLQHDSALRDLYRKLQLLSAPSPELPKRRIGF